MKKLICLLAAAALLVCCMSFYLGSIQTAESAEKKSGAGHPGDGAGGSRNGCARPWGFEIDENHFANLMKADIKDAVYTASACANFRSSTARRTCRVRTRP